MPPFSGDDAQHLRFLRERAIDVRPNVRQTERPRHRFRCAALGSCSTLRLPRLRSERRLALGPCLPAGPPALCLGLGEQLNEHRVRIMHYPVPCAQLSRCLCRADSVGCIVAMHGGFAGTNGLASSRARSWRSCRPGRVPQRSALRSPYFRASARIVVSWSHSTRKASWPFVERISR